MAGDAAGATFEKSASCHLKLQSPHEAASSYTDAAHCFKKTNVEKAVLLYKEVVSIHIDMGRFSQAAKIQKEMGELHESAADTQAAMEAYQTAADYYASEESHSTANQMLLKVAELATGCGDIKRAIEIYEQVAIASLESNLLKYSVKEVSRAPLSPHAHTHTRCGAGGEAPLVWVGCVLCARLN